MKTVMIALLLLLFIVPGAVATYLALAYLTQLDPVLYFVLFWLAVGFTTVAVVWSPSRFTPSAEEQLDSPSVTHHQGNSFQEKNHEKSQKSEVRS